MFPISLAGSGWWAHHAHLPAILAHPDAALVAASDPDPERLAALTAAVPGVRTNGTVEELLAPGDIDALVVASPAAFHYGAARAGLLAGAHVLVEKPFTLHATEAHELVDLAAQQGLGLTVSLPYQHTRAASTARSLLAAGAVGRLVAVHAVFESYTGPLYHGDVDEYLRRVNRPHALAPLPGTYADPAIAGGGHGQSQTSHVVSAVMDAVDARPLRSTGESAFASPGMDVANAIAVQLEGGAVASILSSGATPPGQLAQQSISYLGDRGSVRHDLARATLDWTTVDGDTGHVEPGPGESGYPNGAPVTALLNAAAAAEREGSVEGLRDLTRGAERAAWAVEIIEQLYRPRSGV